VGIGGFLAYRGLSGKDKPAASASAAAAATTAPATTTGDAGEPASATTAPATTGDAADTDAGGGGSSAPAALTKQEAKGVVNEFLSLRDQGRIDASLTLCSRDLFHVAVWRDMVNDQYWNPWSWTLPEATRLADDRIAVTSLGVWESGEEPVVFAVIRDPDTGQTLISGFLDPNDLSEAWIP
jgi:hypothetical protein